MSAPKKPTGLHRGHRDRVRDEIKQSGFSAFADHKLLEYYLFSFIPRKDTNEIAHNLINTFGSLNNVLYADHTELSQVKGMTQNAALGISALPEFLRRIKHHLSLLPLRLDSSVEAANFCRTEFFNKKHEQVLLICLDTANRVLNSRIISEGGLTEAGLSVRAVCEVAYRFKAHKVLLAHNHPSGLLSPSQQDIDFTADLTVALSYLGIMMLDHLIIADGGVYSFHNSGVMDQLVNKNSDKISASVADAIKETPW